MAIKIKDEYPGGFEVDENEVMLNIDGFSQVEKHYNAVPTRRGLYTFGAFHVRVQGVLGLAGKQFKITEADVAGPQWD